MRYGTPVRGRRHHLISNTPKTANVPAPLVADPASVGCGRSCVIGRREGDQRMLASNRQGDTIETAGDETRERQS